MTANELELATARLDLEEAREQLAGMLLANARLPDAVGKWYDGSGGPGWRALEFRVARLELKVKALEGEA